MYTFFVLLLIATAHRYRESQTTDVVPYSGGPDPRLEPAQMPIGIPIGISTRSLTSIANTTDRIKTHDRKNKQLNGTWTPGN